MQARYQLFSSGDLSATFALIFDILSVILFNATILIYGFNFPAEIVNAHIIPGTCIGVLIGSIAFAGLNYRLYKKTGLNTTAIPFGLDAPTAIAIAVCVIGPLYKILLSKNDPQAAIHAWHAGVGCLVLISFIKIIGSFFADYIHRHLPRSALLGAIAGVAVTFIGFIPLVAIFGHPIIGFLSMGLIFLTMFGKIKPPFNIPGILFTVILVSIVYYLFFIFFDANSLKQMFGAINLNHYSPIFDPSIIFSNPSLIFGYASIALPLAILTMVGSLTIVESAKAERVEYKARGLIFVDGIASLIAAFFGGVIQTTPYAGYPAYLKMQARSGFLIINSLILFTCVTLGVISIFIQIIPESIIAPVLLFVAFEIVSQAFAHSNKNHFPTVLFAILPAIAKLITIKITDPQIISAEAFEKLAFSDNLHQISDKLILILLGNGFIITGLLWGALLFFIIENEWSKAVLFSLILSVFSYFGLIHSVFLSGTAYLPWMLDPSIAGIPTLIAEAYLALAALMLVAKLRCRFYTNKLL